MNVYMSYFTYVLRSKKDNKIYIGQTSNLEKRIFRHNENLVNYTRNKGPWELIHFDVFETRAQAMRKEEFYKNGFGRRLIKSILSGHSSGG